MFLKAAHLSFLLALFEQPASCDSSPPIFLYAIIAHLQNNVGIICKHPDPNIGAINNLLDVIGGHAQNGYRGEVLFPIVSPFAIYFFWQQYLFHNKTP